MTFKYDIVDLSLSSNDSVLLIQEYKLNKKKTGPAFGMVGYAHALNLYSLDHYWTKPELGNATEGWSYQLIGGKIFNNNPFGKYTKLDTKSGKALNKLNYSLLYFDDSTAVFIGRKLGLQGLPMDIYSAIDISNDSILWSQQFDNKRFLQTTPLQIDSGRLFCDVNLYFQNLHSGESWTHDLESIYRFPVSNSAQTFFNSISFLTMVVDDRITFLWQIRSEPLIDNDLIYIASRNKLECLSNKGIVNWQLELPPDSVSSSQLYNWADYLTLLNTGSALYGWDIVPFGYPFISKYNKTTRSREFHYVFEKDSTEYVRDALINDSTLYLIYSNTVYAFNMGTNDIQKYPLPKGSYKCTGFLTDDRYILSDSSSYYPFISSDSTLFLTLSNDSICKLNLLSNEYRFFSDQQVNAKVGEYKNFIVLENELRPIIIDSNGNEISQLNGLKNVLIDNNIIVSSNENNLYLINLDQLTVP
ncbi:hypothetical protein [Mangrovibacterium lignilyticum]|uniref:hypothetical protein n=1 Tax=Mangrovibacterium lignilyticum TaxID=2668052 RepID=UPI0013D7E6A1|nr:hypothetical protein [Mangrovibacterium lignilyticum]